jgi:hypothetical protein
VAYQPTILADNPVHYWRLNEGPGALHAYDWGSLKRHLNVDGYGLVIQGGSSIAPAVAPLASGAGWHGITADGGGWAFNGPSLIAPGTTSGLADPTIGYSNPGSIECWTLQQNPQASLFVGYWDPNGPVNQKNLGMSVLSASVSMFAFTASSPGLIALPDDALFHHLVFTWSGTAAAGYLDGSQKFSSTMTVAPPISNRAWVIVGSGQPSNVVAQNDGLVTEVALYNVALTPGQVSAHFGQADQANIFPQWKGVPVPVVPPPVTGVLNTVNHAGLTGAGQFVVTDNYAFQSTLTIIPPSYGQAVDSPTFYFDLGFVSAITANGVTATYRLTRTQEFHVLPPFVTALSWSLAPGVVLTLSEFQATH